MAKFLNNTEGGIFGNRFFGFLTLFVFCALILIGSVSALTDCGTISVPGTYILQNEIISDGGYSCIDIASSNVIIDGNGKGLMGINGANRGINVKSGMNDGVSNTTIKNFKNISGFVDGIYNSGHSWDNSSPMHFSAIFNNTFSLINHTAIGFIRSNNNLVENNSFYNVSTGIHIHYSQNNILRSNTFERSGSGIYTPALMINYDSHNNTLEKNVITDAHTAITIYEWSNNNLLKENEIVKAKKGILIQYCHWAFPINNIFLNNAFRLIEEESINSSISNPAPVCSNSGSPFNTNILIYNNSFGEIKWTSADFLSNLSVSGNLSFPGNIVISDDLVFVNSTVFAGQRINSSANVTLYNMSNKGFCIPAILKDGFPCADCYNFTPLNADMVIFGVSSWSNYSIGDASIPFDFDDNKYIDIFDAVYALEILSGERNISEISCAENMVRVTLPDILYLMETF